MALDQREFRNALGSLALDPPLVLWSLDKAAYSREAFHAAGYFAVNVLGADQVELSRHFSKRHIDKFGTVDVGVGEGGVALLPKCAAQFECRTEHIYDGGDHLLFIGEVLAFRYDSAVAPLAFAGGAYAETARHSSEHPPIEESKWRRAGGGEHD